MPSKNLLHESLEILAPIGFVVEGPVELGFVGAVEDLAKMRTGFDVEFYEVRPRRMGLGALS